MNPRIRIDSFWLYNTKLNERLGLNNIVSGFTVCDIIEKHSNFIKYDAKEFTFYANPKAYNPITKKSTLERLP